MLIAWYMLAKQENDVIIGSFTRVQRLLDETAEELQEGGLQSTDQANLIFDGFKSLYEGQWVWRCEYL
jgi:hypothetical protein